MDKVKYIIIITAPSYPFCTRYRFPRCSPWRNLRTPDRWGPLSWRSPVCCRSTCRGSGCYHRCSSRNSPARSAAHTCAQKIQLSLRLGIGASEPSARPTFPHVNARTSCCPFFPLSSPNLLFPTIWLCFCSYCGMRGRWLLLSTCFFACARKQHRDRWGRFRNQSWRRERRSSTNFVRTPRSWMNYFSWDFWVVASDNLCHSQAWCPCSPSYSPCRTLEYPWEVASPFIDHLRVLLPLPPPN